MYGCDCDGVRREPVDSGADEGLRGHLRVIAHVTGHRPPTCPWRGLYEPLVHDVINASPFKGGDLTQAIGVDPDNRLAQAIGVYRRSVEATTADERRIEAEERERQKNHAAAARKAGIRG